MSDNELCPAPHRSRTAEVGWRPVVAAVALSPDRAGDDRQASLLTGVLLATVLAWVLTGCATVATDSPAAVTPGDSEVVALGEKDLGFGRTYRLHVPAGIDAASEPAPLVVALHGGLATARIFEQQSGLSDLADRQGFLVAYPNGVGIFNLLRHWNAEWCCAKARRAGIDDLARIDQMIDDIAEQWPVDRERIYVVGYSNGGMLAHLYAARRSESLAGLAVFAGPADVYRTDATQRLKPAGRLPVMLIHGTDDRRLPVRGSEQIGTPLGAFDSAALWARSNGCLVADDQERTIQPKPSSSSPAVERVRLCADDLGAVELLVLDGWGHEWPGKQRLGKKSADHPLQGFDAASEIWSFFSRLPATEAAASGLDVAPSSGER